MQTSAEANAPTYQVRRVSLTRPVTWLGQGWRDLLDHPVSSLAYGFLVSFMGWVILLFNNHPYLIAGSLSGFLLVGPIMTCGLCELSRRRDSGEERDFESSLRALRRNRHGLMGFAGCLLLVGLVWILTSTMLLEILLGDIAPSLAATVWGDVWQQLTLTQVVAYFAVGSVLAAVVFAISVVSIPMILDRGVGAGVAMGASLRAFWKDLPAMLVWAVLIVLLVALGFATFLVGMIVIFPLLGHATWQVYRDLVQEASPGA